MGSGLVRRNRTGFQGAVGVPREILRAILQSDIYTNKVQHLFYSVFNSTHSLLLLFISSYIPVLTMLFSSSSPQSSRSMLIPNPTNSLFGLAEFERKEKWWKENGKIKVFSLQLVCKEKGREKKNEAWDPPQSFLLKPAKKTTEKWSKPFKWQFHPYFII